MRRVHVPISIPDPVFSALRAMRKRLRPVASGTRDLRGDRDLEWSWVAARIPSGPGAALDFGCGGSFLGLIAAERGFRVTAVDLEDIEWPYRHARLAFLRGDIFELGLEPEHFDLVINCSAIEHVGLPGRYGVVESRAEGDLAAMARMRALMKPGGRMLLTIPVGRDAVFPPWHRVYGGNRLPRLLEGFSVERREYWIKDAENRWVSSDESAVLNATPRAMLYGLGCFALRRA
ncbi:MAG: DUF268 domain-containing protein [Candidatus Latescibacteria bacterium]|nr:DUF268 domain-containing protein [Candidatus Latescibacterota bacterium]